MACLARHFFRHVTLPSSPDWSFAKSPHNGVSYVPFLLTSRAYSIGQFLFSVAWLNANHYSPWLNFQAECLALLAILFMFVSRLVDQSRIALPHISGWVMFAGLLPWLQYLGGISPFAGDALLGSLYLSALLIAILVGYAMVSAKGSDASTNWLGLAHAIWIAAMLSAAIGLAQWFNLADDLGIYAVQTDIGARAAGNMGQPNQLATLLLMGITALVYVYEQKVVGKTTLVVAVAFLTGVLVLTQSRAGMVSVVVIAAFLLWKQSGSNFRLPKQAVIWWVAGFTLATLSLPSLSKWLLMADARSLTATESVSERWLIWKQVAFAIGQAPWLGYGWNQTPAANAVGALAFPGSTTYTNAHNIVLDLMVWCGIPLGLLLSGLMAYWTVSRMRAARQPHAIWAMVGLIPIGVHSLLEFPFAYAYFLIAAGLFVGIVEAGHAPIKVVQIKAHWLWLMLCTWAGLGSYMAYEYFQIEEDFRIVRFESLHVGQTPASYQVPQVWMLSHMAAMLKAARLVPAPNISHVELNNLRQVADRFAYGTIRFHYALALGLNGDPSGASRQMAIIYSMYGPVYYKACREELLQQAQDKYPQLALVQLPTHL